MNKGKATGVLKHFIPNNNAFKYSIFYLISDYS